MKTIVFVVVGLAASLLLVINALFKGEDLAFLVVMLVIIHLSSVWYGVSLYKETQKG